jgi:hypothetical protein
MNTVRSEAVRKALVAWMAVVVVATPCVAQTQQVRDGDRQQFELFMGELRQAVQVGANAMLKQMRQVSGRVSLQLARPVDVEGHRFDEGLFFRVRVPSIPPTSLLAYQILTGGGQQARRTNVTVTPSGLTPASTAGATASVVPPTASPYVDPDLDFDPDEVYTREVKTALVNTMIRLSRELRLAPGQHLTVAARDDGQPDSRFPSGSSEFHTVYFRIDGTDLAAFHAGKTTLEQVLKAVKSWED